MCVCVCVYGRVCVRMSASESIMWCHDRSSDKGPACIPVGCNIGLECHVRHGS